ncbi:MAG: hypothetical protein OXC07_09370 [Kistimonas sp.]|nr:hypothetical protein [Kistimonas sp.]
MPGEKRRLSLLPPLMNCASKAAVAARALSPSSETQPLQCVRERSRQPTQPAHSTKEKSLDFAQEKQEDVRPVFL